MNEGKKTWLAVKRCFDTAGFGGFPVYVGLFHLVCRVKGVGKKLVGYEIYR